MPKTSIEIKVTKFYLLAWLFGIAAIICMWHRWYLFTGILLMVSMGYSRADFLYPPADDKKTDDASDDSNNDDSGGLTT